MQAPPPYEYGDLSGKHGKLNATSGSGSFVGAGQGFVSDVTLPLSGDWSVLGYVWKTAAQIRRQGVASSLGRLADVFWLAGHTGLVYLPHLGGRSLGRHPQSGRLALDMRRYRAACPALPRGVHP